LHRATERMFVKHHGCHLVSDLDDEWQILFQRKSANPNAACYNTRAYTGCLKCESWRTNSSRGL